MFFFKSKSIHIDCFTTRPEVLEFSPIVESRKTLPEWWKNLPKKVDKGNIMPIPTMKSCTGFTSYYSKGITIPMWCDLAIESLEQGYKYQFSDATSTIDFHNSFQYDGFVDIDKYSHMKIISPWKFICKEDVNWIWSHPVWAYNDPSMLIGLPAIVGYKYQHGTNINFLFPKSVKKMLVSLGKPLVNIVAISDRKVVIHNHLVSTEEFQMMDVTTKKLSFGNRYNTIKKLTNMKTESKCPFGFS